MKATRWVRVSLPYATFALGCDEGKVVVAPPIAKWTLGRDEREVSEFYRSKGAEFTNLPIGGRGGPE